MGAGDGRRGLISQGKRNHLYGERPNIRRCTTAISSQSTTNRMPEQDEPTVPCRVCGRKFIRASLEKHEPVCKKLSKLNRKPFDSGKQRATGSDITIHDVRKAQKEKEMTGGQFSRPKTNWRERHSHFIEAVSASKKVDYALKTGAPLPPPPKTTIPSDYVQCEYCGRNFNEKAAERHVPFCREQNTRKGPLKAPAKPLSAHKPLPSSHSTRARDNSREPPATRSGSQTRDRRRSVDTRTPKSRQSPSRPTANSAGVGAREPVPPTPMRRSNSAPRTPAAPSRLKTPGLPPRISSKDRAPKTPKNRMNTAVPESREQSRSSTSRSRRY